MISGFYSFRVVKSRTEPVPDALISIGVGRGFPIEPGAYITEIGIAVEFTRFETRADREEEEN